MQPGMWGIQVNFWEERYVEGEGEVGCRMAGQLPMLKCVCVVGGRGLRGSKGKYPRYSGSFVN